MCVYPSGQRCSVYHVAATGRLYWLVRHSQAFLSDDCSTGQLLPPFVCVLHLRSDHKHRMICL